MTNRLARSDAPPGKSALHAWEWLEGAQRTGDMQKIRAWKQAVQEDWDEEHFCPLAAEEYRNKVCRGG